MADDSEFRAYSYIEQVLGQLGWDTRNPSRGGQVYTQGEFRRHDTLLTEALGRKAPENVVVIPWDGGPRYWIVESKAAHRDLAKALREAQGYADQVNALDTGAARFATGIAGTPDQSFYVTTTYWDGREWREVAINNYETTGFLTLDQCHHILDANNAKLALFDDDPDRFLKKANAINRTLHNNEVPVGERAGVMAALLLALAQDGNLRIHAQPSALMREVNGLIEDLLRQHGKEEFANVIQLRLPATAKNHKRYRKAIVDTLQHLREMNIRSAINSGDDALGKFYETFLKYANGAKEMGVVLTPRHITRFAVEVLGIGPRDRVFDPACGTGGFLISAMEAIRASRPGEYNAFRNDGLFGVEIRDDVYGLAIVNMIFRGDGKSRVYDGNCFEHEFWRRDGEVWYTLPDDREPEGAHKPFSRVLMNPPFKLRTNETAFVNYGLRQARPEALLFAVLPAVVIGGKRHEDWRRELLKRHTVLACVKLDKNLFYPVAEATYALIVRAHQPHRSSGKVFMGCLFDDDHRPRRSKMLSAHTAVDNVDSTTSHLKRFILGQEIPESIPRELRVTTLDQDNKCDFLPENQISGGSPMINAAFRAIEADASARRASVKPPAIAAVQETGTFSLEPFIAAEVVAPLQTLKEYSKGAIPVVSAAATDNGVADRLDIPADLCIENCITISLLHNTKPCEAFWHPYRFSALSGKALVLRPTAEMLAEPLAILYLCEAITACNAWRYNYAHSPSLHELEVEVPVTQEGQPDIAMMADIVRRQIS